MRKLLALAAGAAIGASVMAIPAAATGPTPAERPSIAGLVSTSGGEFDHVKRDFDILLTAVVTAELAATLDGADLDATVFAPTDRAFTRLARDLGYTGAYDEEAVWNFLVEALTGLGGGDPIPVLTNVLLYHVAPGSPSIYEVVDAAEVETLLDGAVITPAGLTLGDNDPDITDPKITKPFQLRASNGYVLPIDRVLVPLDL